MAYLVRYRSRHRQGSNLGAMTDDRGWHFAQPSVRAPCRLPSTETAAMLFGEGLLSDLLDQVTGKKKQQLLSDQQDRECCRQHAHAQQLARGYLFGQRTLECRLDRQNLHRRRAQSKEERSRSGLSYNWRRARSRSMIRRS